MANGPMPRAALCALLLCASCSSNPDPEPSSNAGASGSTGAGATGQNGGGAAGPSAAAGAFGLGGADASGGMAASAGKAATGGASNIAGGATQPSGGAGAGPPPAVDGQSIYALECHGDSKDCNLATVPCFGVGTQVPNVAAGWACANRCQSDADCSDAPSGAAAQASCVPFTSTGHCMLVCQNENESFACPTGMSCYTPPKSPVGYCLWQ